MKTGNTKQRLPISWFEQTWAQPIVKAFQKIRRSPATSSRLSSGLKPMHSASRLLSKALMKNSMHLRQQRGFTLIEMLVVIAIIGILAGLLIPAVIAAKQKAKITKVKTEMENLATAIKGYETAYSRMPATKELEALSIGSPVKDLTYGLTDPSFPGAIPTNSVIMAVIMDLERYANGNVTVNDGHSRNPQKQSFYTAKDAPSANGPGLGSDGEFRDPWGNSYIITIDMDDNNNCEDPYYGNIRGDVVVWSKGPDGRAAKDINDPVNKDNIRSWK